eukprot:g172.t1
MNHEFAADLLQTSKMVRDSVRDIRREARRIADRVTEESGEGKLSVVGFPATKRRSGKSRNKNVGQDASSRGREKAKKRKQKKSTTTRRDRQGAKQTMYRKKKELEDDLKAIQQRLHRLWSQGRWSGMSLREMLKVFQDIEEENTIDSANISDATDACVDQAHFRDALEKRLNIPLSAAEIDIVVASFAGHATKRDEKCTGDAGRLVRYYPFIRWCEPWTSWHGDSSSQNDVEGRERGSAHGSVDGLYLNRLFTTTTRYSTDEFLQKRGEMLQRRKRSKQFRSRIEDATTALKEMGLLFAESSLATRRRASSFLASVSADERQNMRTRAQGVLDRFEIRNDEDRRVKTKPHSVEGMLLESEDMARFLADMHSALASSVSTRRSARNDEIDDDDDDDDDVSSARNELLPKGAAVEMRFPASRRWFAGKIVKFHPDDTYDVKCDDGSVETHVSRAMIRERSRGKRARSAQGDGGKQYVKEPIVYLGGTDGGPWGWRQRVVQPMLEGLGVPSLDPRSSKASTSSENEAEDAHFLRVQDMRRRAGVFLYVIESDALGVPEMIDAAVTIASGEAVALAIVDVATMGTSNVRLSDDVGDELNRARGFLAAVATRYGVKVWSSARDAAIDAVRKVEDMRGSARHGRRLDERRRSGNSNVLESLRQWRRKQRRENARTSRDTRIRNEDDSRRFRSKANDVEIVDGSEWLSDDDLKDAKLPSEDMLARLQAKLRAQSYGADTSRPFHASAKAIFSRLDADHDRGLSRDEFVPGVRRLCPLHVEEANALFDAIDFDSDGTISPAEFMTFMEQWILTPDRESIEGPLGSTTWHTVLCKDEKETMQSLRRENERLRSELAALDDGFFEDVEELKFRYARAVRRLIALRRESRGEVDDEARWNARRWEVAIEEFERSDIDRSGYIARGIFCDAMRRHLKLSRDEVEQLAKSVQHRQGGGGENFISYKSLKTLMTLPIWPSNADSRDAERRKSVSGGAHAPDYIGIYGDSAYKRLKRVIHKKVASGTYSVEDLKRAFSKYDHHSQGIVSSENFVKTIASLFEIPKKDCVRLSEIFDISKNDRVQYAHFLYPVHPEPEDVAEIRSSIDEWKKMAEQDADRLKKLIRSKEEQQTRDKSETVKSSKKSDESKRRSKKLRNVHKNSPYLNKHAQKKKESKPTLPGIFRGGKGKLSRPTIPTRSPISSPSQNQAGSMMKMNRIVGGLAARLEAEQKINEKLQEQLLKHQRQGEQMLQRLREEQAMRRELRAELVARASPEAREREKLRAEEKMRRELNAEIAAERKRRIGKQPYSLGNFATKQERRLKKQSGLRSKRGKKANGRSKKGSSSDHSTRRTKLPNFMKSVDKSSERSVRFQVRDTHAAVCAQMKKRQRVYQVLDYDCKKTDGRISNHVVTVQDFSRALRLVGLYPETDLLRKLVLSFEVSNNQSEHASDLAATAASADDNVSSPEAKSNAEDMEEDDGGEDDYGEESFDEFAEDDGAESDSKLRKKALEKSAREEKERVESEQKARRQEQARRVAERLRETRDRAKKEAAESARLDKKRREAAAERKRRKEEAERKRRKEEAERKRRKEEAERKRRKEEAERKRRKEEAERKRRNEEAERKRCEEAERKRREEAAERKRREKEAERKRQEEVMKRKQREEAERKRREEIERKRQEEAERKRREEIERKRQEEVAERKRREEAEQTRRKKERLAKEKAEAEQLARERAEAERAASEKAKREQEEKEAREKKRKEEDEKRARVESSYIAAGIPTMESDDRKDEPGENNSDNNDYRSVSLDDFEDDDDNEVNNSDAYSDDYGVSDNEDASNHASANQSDAKTKQDDSNQEFRKRERQGRRSLTGASAATLIAESLKPSEDDDGIVAAVDDGKSRKTRERQGRRSLTGASAATLIAESLKPSENDPPDVMDETTMPSSNVLENASTDPSYVPSGPSKEDDNDESMGYSNEFSDADFEDDDSEEN